MHIKCLFLLLSYLSQSLVQLLFHSIYPCIFIVILTYSHIIYLSTYLSVASTMIDDRVYLCVVSHGYPVSSSS